MKYFCHHQDKRNPKHPTPDSKAGWAHAGTGAGIGKHLGAWFLLLGVLVVPPARAQTDAASESRYLLIVDTSAAMKRRSENVQRVAGDLIYSGMNGQMRSGDTIGVWTFNEALSTGNLPLLRWAPERRASVAGKVTEFLRTQKFEKESRLETAIPTLQLVVSNSPKLTVLIISDGGSPLTGTPFDAEIAAAYEPFRETQRKERMPFVTVLRAKAGEYLGYAVTPAPWAVEFPKFPPDPVVAKPEPKPEPPKPVVPPLIVIGKKDTNAPSVELPQPGTEPKLASKPGMTEAEKLFARLAAEQGLQVETTLNTNAALPTTTPVENIKPAPATIEAPKPVPQPGTNRNETVNTAAPPPAATVTTNAIVTEPTPVPAVPAVVVPVDRHSSRLMLVAAAVSVLVVALGVAYALLRRRHRAHVSLITSSMDRPRK